MSSYHEDRAILAETIGKLASFIQSRTSLPAIKCQTLAMDILCNSKESGVVSAVKAAKLLQELHETI